MNFKLRLAEEEGPEDGAAGGPTLEFIFEKEELNGQGQRPPCAGNDTPDPAQTPNSDSGPDPNP